MKNIDYREIVPESVQNIYQVAINEAKQRAKEFLADKDALVIPGNNAAVNAEAAEQFGGEVTVSGKSDFARSLAEMVMVEVAIEKGLPIMGICGGHQVINSYLKGKITDVHNTPNHDSIIIEPTSELAAMTKANPNIKETEVRNQRFWARHHNAVQEIGGKDRLIDKKIY